ncbi:cytochrome c biogenesis protein DipZ [Robbsia sp. Bb-Pol-6]|uniref:Cytochrome c biogenesis protein DipZ n=1 Tax=Robbsia betulipollinis TaxID=2981849 RepID=A0ABT3ZGZ0_9BURK|nr:cytochrome c biogenesis protein DipZ [Robbsia betulipollinis]MCY0385795.1 cytochrome c biogenesis protein DipZ [Robbsia betulipollinis]
MLVLFLSYLGGVLTIVSPCILPVLPFVFSRANEPFLKSGLPLLIGMALTFALVATLAAIGGGWVAQANAYGRWAAIVLLAVFGLTLLFPRFADRLMRPLVTLGDRLSNAATVSRNGTSFGASLLLGVATGLLWAPCAGPILGLVLTGAALRGASVGTTLLLLAYAAGAATSLAAALLVGGRVFAAMKRSIGAGEWVRRLIGAAMLCGVVAISLGWDTGVLARVSTVATGGLEQKLVDRFSPQPAEGPDAGGAMMARNASVTGAGALPVEGTLPPLSGAVAWLNSPPLRPESLRGKVVLIDFWTYSCINCLRTLPYVKAWAQKYRDEGLVVIGVHAPEFAFERDIANVTRQTRDLGITYPVAIDNDYAIWRGFNNQYWPAQYFVDAQGRIRHHHFGEGDDVQSEKVIQQLLTEAGSKNVPTALIDAESSATGAEVLADNRDMRSPETYIGYERAGQFSSPGGVARDAQRTYTVPAFLALNGWGLSGDWNVSGEQARLVHAGGRIVYRFHARDLHLVLGPGRAGVPVHFRVTIDGHAPGDAHGVDVAADGTGVVDEHRLYQLIRQSGAIQDRTFAIEFTDPDVQAYAFTFG